MGSVSLSGTLCCVTKQTVSVPRTAMAVSPLLFAALNAYSTWYSRPSGLKMVLQTRVTGRQRGRRLIRLWGRRRLNRLGEPHNSTGQQSDHPELTCGDHSRRCRATSVCSKGHSGVRNQVSSGRWGGRQRCLGFLMTSDRRCKPVRTSRSRRGASQGCEGAATRQGWQARLQGHSWGPCGGPVGARALWGACGRPGPTSSSNQLGPSLLGAGWRSRWLDHSCRSMAVRSQAQKRCKDSPCCHLARPKRGCPLPRVASPSRHLQMQYCWS